MVLAATREYKINHWPIATRGVDLAAAFCRMGERFAREIGASGAGQRGVRGRADYSGRQRRGAVRLERARGGLFVPRERKRERS